MLKTNELKKLYKIFRNKEVNDILIEGISSNSTHTSEHEFIEYISALIGAILASKNVDKTNLTLTNKDYIFILSMNSYPTFKDCLDIYNKLNKEN